MGHKRVHLADRQVAARSNIDDRVLRLCFNEELHAVSILGEVQKHADDERSDQADHDQGHDWIANDGVDERSKECSAIPGLNRAWCAGDLYRSDEDRHQRRGEHEQDRTRKHRDEGRCIGILLNENARIDRDHRGHKHAVPDRDGHGEAHGIPRNQSGNQGGPALNNTCEPRRHTAQNRQVDQCHNQRGREHEDQRNRQHPHELAWDTGPEQHWQEGAQRRRGGRHDRPEHTLGRIGIGLHRARAGI